MAQRIQSILTEKAEAWNTSFSFGFRRGDIRLGIAAGVQDFGAASSDPTRLMTNRSYVPMGSVTKPFTAAAVLQLVAAGKFSLDSPIVPLVDPALKKWNKTSMTAIFGEGQRALLDKITVRSVLGMRSG